jgi:hypothetical protein
VSWLAPIALVVGMLISVRLPAQVEGGMLGTIADPSGALIPSAQVSIKNLATNVITTNGEGDSVGVEADVVVGC